MRADRRAAPLAACILALAASASPPAHGVAAGGAAATAAPVLVELFTSEGCSSCPPADAALAALAAERTIAGAEVIALEEHVDYWNHLGWVDPFSSATFSRRQAAYADALRAGVYTPQMVIDGRTELVGSRRDGARDAIARAGASRKVGIRLSVRSAADAAHVRIVLDGSGPIDRGAELWLAITEEALSTTVEAGENGGRTLAHGPVVRILRNVGAVDGRSAIETDVPTSAAWKAERLRVVAFLQEPTTRAVIGAAAVPFPPNPAG